MRESYPSPFVAPVSVQAWDAWFRWRGPEGLHDLAIEHTWSRVADFMAQAGTASTSAVRAELQGALSAWQILPDEQLLANAGTDRPLTLAKTLDVAINAAAFVMLEHDLPTLALGLMVERTELAVCISRQVAATVDTGPPLVRVTLIGIADALARLELPYDSDAGRTQAKMLAQAVARGTARGNKPPAARCPGSAEAAQSHPALTALHPKPRLALLANDVADCADPLWSSRHAEAINTPESRLIPRVRRHALHGQEDQHRRSRARPDTLANVPWQAQLDMRAALQPWVDLPITHPLLLLAPPNGAEMHEMERYAARCGLPVPLRVRIATNPLRTLP